MKMPTRILRVLSLFLAAWALAGASARAADAKLPDALSAQLERIFAKKDFEAKKFGPARWMEGGGAYTTVEPSAAVAVRATSSVTRRPPARAASSSPPGARCRRPARRRSTSTTTPGRKDGKRLLIFTNTRRVWRQNTRGDYWVLDLRTRQAAQARRRGAEPSTLMFAKLSPDGARVGLRPREQPLRRGPGAPGAITPLTTRRLRRRSSTARPTGCTRRSSTSATASAGAPTASASPTGSSTPAACGDFPLIDNTDAHVPDRRPRSRTPRPASTNSAVRVGRRAGRRAARRAGSSCPATRARTTSPRMEWAGSSQRARAPAAQPAPEHATTCCSPTPRPGEVRHACFTDTDEAWVDVDGRLCSWLDDGQSLLWLSERDGWRHVYVGLAATAAAVRLITPRRLRRDAASTAVDENGGWLYFMASPENADAALPVPRRASTARARRSASRPPDQPGTHATTISPDGAVGGPHATRRSTRRR